MRAARFRARSRRRPPEDADEFRNDLVLRIIIFTGTKASYWRDCKEAGCRRARACLAPQIDCSNAPLLPDPDGKEWAQVSLKVYHTVKARLAELCAEDA